MRFVSLFAGIGGFDLSVSAVVAAFGIKGNKSVLHKSDSYFLQLVMPIGVRLPVCDGEIIKVVVVFIQVNMVDAFILAKGSLPFAGSDKDMFGDVARLVCIRMVGLKDVVVAIPKCAAFAALTFCFSSKKSASLPVGVQRTVLITLRRWTRRNAHFLHCSLDYVLRHAVLLRYLVLTHFQVYIIAIKLFFSEGYLISVLVAHSAGIIPDSSGY